MIYPNSLTQLNDDLKRAPNTAVVALAQRIIEGAKKFDLERTVRLGVNFRLSKIVRNQDNPPTYTHDSILGASYADDENNPLQPGEEWNKGRRATNTGVTYGFNQAGHPVNPYMNTGLNGRGVLGQFATNHAVDNGVLVLKADDSGDMGLYAMGILRKFDNDAPAFAGGFAKYQKDAQGGYVYDGDAIVETKVEEFFEEMISGSIHLLPEYESQVEVLLQKEITARMKARNGQEISADLLEEIKEQTETALKLRQVRDKDPDFLGRLRYVISTGRECFAGPVLNDNRSTNNAWIETRLSWFLLDDATWNYIKGDNPVFDYQFSEGDDASGVLLHKLDKDLIENAFASHGAMFAFMAASYLLASQQRGLSVDPAVMEQMQDIVSFFDEKFPQNGPVSSPAINTVNRFSL